MKDFSNEAYYLFFSSLANRTSLAIIDVLKDGAKSVCEIAAILEQEQDTISANIKPLEKSALVLSEGSGNENVYSLNKEIVEPLAEILEFHASKHCPGMRECIPQEKLREYMKKEAEKWTYISE